jgi:cytidylate kinase
MIIAIDGPAGSGKTTIARNLAKKLNIAYLDTGATYRALTLKVIESGVGVSDEGAVATLGRDLLIQFKENKVYLDGREVTYQIRQPRIDKYISAVVKHPRVREVMVALQRSLAHGRDCVVEGRDITTVVFPQAEFKFYLDADPAVRATRRYEELRAKGVDVSLDELTRDLQMRDSADKGRSTGPLRISEDAVYIDTTHMSREEVVEEMLRFMRTKGQTDE